MVDYRAYVAPNVNVNGKREVVVLQSRLGLVIAASLTPNFGDVFQVDDGQAFKSERFFRKTVSDAVVGKDEHSVAKILDEFQRGYNGLKLTRITSDEIRPHTYAEYCRSHSFLL